MKKLLTLITVLLCLDAAAQVSIINDTSVVRTPFAVSRSGRSSRDTLSMPAATTAQNGFATAASLSNIVNLQTDVTTLNNNITSLQGSITAASTPKALRSVVTDSYTLVADDNGRLIDVNNPSTKATTTIIVPPGLPDGFTCDILARRGTVTVVGNEVTINSFLGYRKSQTPNAYMVIRVVSDNVVALSGNLKL